MGLLSNLVIYACLHSHCCLQRNLTEQNVWSKSLANQEKWERSCRDCWKREQRKKTTGWERKGNKMLASLKKSVTMVPFPQLSEWWAQVAYLGYRLPVVVHSSPGIGYPLKPVKGVNQFTRYRGFFHRHAKEPYMIHPVLNMSREL